MNRNLHLRQSVTNTLVATADSNFEAKVARTHSSENIRTGLRSEQLVIFLLLFVPLNFSQSSPKTQALIL
jgi:hypothetical protein